ncbi:Flp family type IVb pilin [Brenneria rubrifaciens]|uniref:Flp family type IVb pilin n=2 Tax=Brenneria rubrifaciens TaxID=55213 RepID=A0A4P8QST1_9GAMM|nr:Flp family type IVb pilin [Brenneria rubrifaciens]
MRKLFKALQKDERGVSALEYAILAGVIVVVVAAGVGGFKGNIETLFKSADSAIKEAATKSESTTAGKGTGG